MSQGAYMDLISGHRSGPAASLGRGALAVLEAGYRSLIRVRNAYYDTWSMPRWLSVPVISVGNLTVGGTGKTPMTLWLCERLLERGRKPAVLSRGYGSAGGAPDELLLISRRCPKAVAVANSNRVAAGELAVAEYGVQAAVLDDGFQHRRMGRDLDIVLVDAARPFGYGHVLPRGLLREPATNLRRAEAIVVTRCDQVAPPELASLDARIRELNASAPIVHATHRPSGFVDLAGEPVHALGGNRIGCFAGIARPEAFVRTVSDMGVRIEAQRWFPDHHAYSDADVRALHDWAREARLDALVTTEKDAVKLSNLDVAWAVPVCAVRIDIAMLDAGESILCGVIDEMLKDHEDANEPEAG